MFAAATVAVLLLFGTSSAEAAKKVVKRGTPAISGIPHNHSVSKASTCGIDLMIIVDESGQIAEDVFEKERQFLLTVLDGLSIGPDATRVAIMKMSVWGYPQTDQFASSKNDAVKAAKDMEQCHGSTNTYQALKLARETFHYHARSKDLGIPRVTVLLGCGYSDDKEWAVKGANELKAEGSTLFTIAIRGGYRVPDYAHYRDLVSEPKDQHSYDYDKNPDLAKSLPNILLGACHASKREAAENVGSE